MEKTDIVICAIPALFVDRLPGAPALLKAAVIEAGYSAMALDLSLNFLVKQCNKNIDTYNKLGCVFRPGELASNESIEQANQWVIESVKKIKSYSPTIVGISVFTVFQHRSAVMLARALRQCMPEIKIVLGGWGLTITCQSLSQDPGIRQIDMVKTFAQFMQDQQLTDYNVFGSGLDELIDIIQSVTGTSNQTNHYDNTDSVIYNAPIPNYDDYDFANYVWNQNIALPVTGSKGCVRSCTFCDIPGQFGRFKYRTGADIANEMMQLNCKYGVKIFEFTDSLVNGSFKAFRQWLEIIANYNDTKSENDKIRWFGQYICRPQVHTPADIYPLMKRAGVQSLIIGVESGSNEVLTAMKKKMTVQDAFDEFDMFESVGISIHILMFGGFYNETWPRFLENLEFIIKCQRYLASGTISQLGMGPPLYINNKMYLGEQADQLGILLDPTDDQTWTAANDPTNTFVERARRRLIAQLVLDKLKIPLSGQSISNLHQMKERLKKQLPKNAPKIPMLGNDQSYLDYLIPSEILEKINSKKLAVQIKFNAVSAQARWPMVRVWVNNQLVADQPIVTGNCITFDTDIIDSQAQLKIEYYKKTNNDTITDATGQMVENQSLEIKQLLINDVDIIANNLYTRLGHYYMLLDNQKKEYYQTHGYNTEPSHSLHMFENGYWQLDFDMPILQNLVQLNTQQQAHEKWPDPELLLEIYSTINTIKELEAIS